MRLERFYDDDLAQASYLVGCEASGEALVVDPNLDTAVYIEAAERYGLRIVAVTETHIHADFLSGARALALATGARLYISGAGPADWQYRFEAPGLHRLVDGDTITIGGVRVRALHTPGHTPEHMAFLVIDASRGEAPVGLLSGDFVFVGDIGRPDLLERAAGHAGSMELGARQLFASLRRFRELPDYVQVWPGHGAGSACGKALGAMPQSTVGYERRFNWALQIDDEARFVEEVLAGQPEPPAYFARMKTLNRDAQPERGGVPELRALGPEDLTALLARGGVVIDTRLPADFAAQHIQGTINVPLRRGFATLAGSIFPDNPEVILIAAGSAVHAAARLLTLIGFDRLLGFVPPDVMDDWADPRHPLTTLPRIEPGEVLERVRRGELVAVDVRNAGEFKAGHVPGALHLPLAALRARLDAVPRDRPVAVHCQGGSRSAAAASYLAAHGFDNVADMGAGFAAWEAQGLPVERPALAG